MTGHIRRRGKNSFELKFDAGFDEATGRRKTRYHSFRGTRREAGEKLAKLVTQYSKGTYVDRSKLTIAEHVASRIDQWEGSAEITAKTAERYRELMNNQIMPHIGSIPVQKLATTDIESWHGTLRKRGRKDGKGGLSNLTIRHAHRVLAQALKDGERHSIVVRNVAAAQGAPVGGNDNEEIAILSEDQVHHVVSWLRGRAMFPKVMTALFTGIRRGELLALKWCRLNFDSREMEICEALEETKAHGIRFKKPKTKSGVRTISLPDIVVDSLREYRKAQLELRVAMGLGKLQDDGLLFPGFDGEVQSPSSFSKLWRDLADEMGLSQITFHALRHTHASQLIDAGIDVVTISKRLGHANPTVTLRIYAHLFRKRDDKAAAAINDALRGFGD